MVLYQLENFENMYINKQQQKNMFSVYYRVYF